MNEIFKMDNITIELDEDGYLGLELNKEYALKELGLYE